MSTKSAFSVVQLQLVAELHVTARLTRLPCNALVRSLFGILSFTARIGSTVRAAHLRLLYFPFLISFPTVQSVVYNLGISFFIFIEFMYFWNPNAKCAWLNIRTWFFSGSFRWNTSASPKGAFKTMDVRERARSFVVASWRLCCFPDLCFRCHGGSHREGGQ